MNNKEWIKQFEEQNGRKPTPEELSLYLNNLSADRSKSIKKQSFLEKIKKFVSTNRKKSVGIFIVLLLVLFSLGGYIYFQSQPKSIFNVLTVEFTGYDGDGELINSNEKEFNIWMTQIILEKSGIEKEQAKLLAADPEGEEKVKTDPRYSSKYPLINNMISSVKIDYDKKNRLKNGDEVTITVTVTNPIVPIKSEKKIFKVENLKEYEKVSAEDLIKEANIQFTGVDGYGKLVDRTNSVLEFKQTDKPKNLKNGDKLIFNVKDSYLEELKSKGKTFEENVVEVTVSGLKSKEDISGTMTEYQPVIDEYLKVLKNKKIEPGYSYVNFEILPNGRPEPVKLYYALYDFDNNGVNELVIAGDQTSKDSKRTSQKYNWERTIYNVFTLNNGKIINNVELLGHLYFLIPMSDGSFWLRGGFSGGTYLYEQYMFNEQGTQLNKVLSINQTNTNNVITIKDEKGKVYTRIELERLLDSFTPLSADDLNWIEIK